MGFFGIFWVFLGFLNFQIGIGFFGIGIFWDFFGFFEFPNWDWVFLGLGFLLVFFCFFGFSLYFLNLKLVLVFFCFLTVIYGNIHNRVLAGA